MLALGVLMGLVAIAGTGGAHESDEHGTLTLHDTEQGPATDTVSCELWVRGQGLGQPSGVVAAAHERDEIASIHHHEVGSFEAREDDGGTYGFQTGPLELHHHETASGEIWVKLVLAGNHATEASRITYTHCEGFQPPLPGDDSHACTGPTTVDALHEEGAIVITWRQHAHSEEPATYTVHRTLAEQRSFVQIAELDADDRSYRDTDVEEGTKYVYTVRAHHDELGGQGDACDHTTITAQGDHPPDRPPACPTEVRATAEGNGDITLRWNKTAGAEVYHVYRSTNGGELEPVAEVDATQHVDEKTAAEVTYAYQVTAANDAGEAQGCDVVQATAIPSFPTLAVMGLAAIGGIVILLALQRWA